MPFFYLARLGMVGAFLPSYIFGPLKFFFERCPALFPCSGNFPGSILVAHFIFQGPAWFLGCGQAGCSKILPACAAVRSYPGRFGDFHRGHRFGLLTNVDYTYVPGIPVQPAIVLYPALGGYVLRFHACRNMTGLC